MKVFLVTQQLRSVTGEGDFGDTLSSFPGQCNVGNWSLKGYDNLPDCRSVSN